jgi:hypothetical protein
LDCVRIKEGHVIINPYRWSHIVHSSAVHPIAAAVAQEAEFIIRTFPSLTPHRWPSSQLILASDYSGMQDGSDYESYSFLLADKRSVAQWASRRGQFRDLMLDDRRISWKKRKDGVQRAAEHAFLSSADLINGVLATFLVDKKTAEHRLFQQIDPTFHPAAAEIGRLWQADVHERAMRVAWIAGTLLAGLASPSQSVAWLPDNDDIMSESTRKLLCGRVALAARVMMQPQCELSLQIATPSDYQNPARRLEREDLLSVPDYAAGALAHFMTATTRLGYDPSSPLISLVKEGVAVDVLRVAAWIGNDAQPLKRWVFVVAPSDEPSAFRFGSIRIHPRLGVLAR